MVVTFDNVSFKYLDKVILDKASFSISNNEKIGVVGVNGCGKTTLIKLITDEIKDYSGTIIKSGGMIINTLPQEPIFDNNKRIIDIIMEESTIEHKIDEFEAKSMLNKFGFDDYNLTPSNFSGGMIKRLALAKVLISYSDLLILDEPTNHLDTDLIIYLEKYLIKYKGAILLVTHDRYFLERICNKMLEMDFGKTYMYDANYNLFLELKAERIERENAEKRKLSNILRVEKEWINRGAEARSTKQKARIERYNELKEIKFNNREMKMKFDSVSTRLGKKLIEIKNGSKSFGNNLIFSDFSFILNRTDIIGVVGKNGSGKTTLFKILMGLIPLDSGELIKGETLKIGYLSQHLELLDPEMRIIDYIDEDRQVIETRDGTITSSQLLERFLFDRYTQYMKIKSLSGGEKRRLQLVKVFSMNPNVLILDEPTNDLDVFTLEILEDYLINFSGPILTVSHDRFFLDKICNKLFIFENKRIKESNEMFSEYLENTIDKVSESKENKQEKYLLEDKRKKEYSKNKKEYQKLDTEINLLDNEINELKKSLALETTDYLKMMELDKIINEKNAILEEKLQRFLELEELL